MSRNLNKEKWKYTLSNLKEEWLTKSTIVFGTIWLFVESLSVFFDFVDCIVKDYGPLIFLFSIIASIIISYHLIKPRTKAEKTFLASNTKICVKLGNLLSERGNIALTTSNYFDFVCAHQTFTN